MSAIVGKGLPLLHKAPCQRKDALARNCAGLRGHQNAVPPIFRALTLNPHTFQTKNIRGEKATTNGV